MLAQQMSLMRAIIVRVLVSFSLVSCSDVAVDRKTTHARLVELVPIEVDRKRVERRNFGALTLLSAFQLASKDKRFGGLSGLSVGRDRRLRGLRPRLLAVGEHAAGTRRRPEGSR